MCLRCDNTKTHARKLCARCYNYALRHHDLPPKPERVRRNLRACVECGYVEFIAGYDRCNACYQRKYRRERK